MDEEKLVHIEGSVDRILFKNEENGYIVLDLDMGNALTTVVGMLGSVNEGEELKLSGEYSSHPKFGVQFKAAVCERKLPETTYAIQKYLASGVIKGIGPTLAQRIVEKFGEQTLNIFETEPQRLLEIKGISPKKYEEIEQEFKRILGIRRLMIHLSQYGVSPSIAVKVWRKWGQFSIDVIKENPYSLCDFGIDLDFHKAEDIADTIGISPDSINRIKAGITYILMENALSGHTCLPTDSLQEKACSILEINEEAFYKTLEQEYNEENLREYMKKNRSFTYLADYFNAENYISDRMAVMNSTLGDTFADINTSIDIEEEKNSIKYGNLQREAISVALSKGFMILTGGPGTGKTTTLNAIISLYQQRGMRVMIAAPTGRAAKRVADLTGYEAKTIHRLLEVGFESNGNLKFIHNEDNPIECDIMIVDEMSMVDVLLFENLLRAMKLSCRLIMLGDCDQLPSVGAGNLLKDLIDSKMITVVSLKEIFRQAQQSCIITNAHKIVTGEMPDLSRKDSDFFFFQRLDENSAADTIVDLYKKRLPKAYGYSLIDDIQILSPTRKGILGIVELNKRLQLEVNPHTSIINEVKGKVYTYREHDKVMQTKNNYEIVWSKDNEPGAGIFNGDIGTIISIEKRSGNARISFDGRIAEYTFEMLNQLELAYAITVHKSQGSEFPVVIIPLLNGFNKLYYRNLLYTAVTRAKKLLIIVGSQTQICDMISNNRKSLRYSCLKSMLREKINNEQNG
ncbi:MAG: ATP-dependent RecD-like DNA helicase [Oscillospiraceae bacterium]